MAKIETIAELLVDEIDAFEKQISILKKERALLEKTELKPDVSFIHELFQKMHSNQLKSTDLYLKIIEKLDTKLSKKMILPKWTVILISLLSITQLTFLLYMLHMLYII